MKPPKDQNSVLPRYMDGPTILDRSLAGLKDADLDATPSQGGWTIRQIVHHIVDGDDLWKTCIKIALGNEQAEFTLEWYRALSQEEWADHWAYTRRSLDASLALLKANRNHILQLLEQIPDGWYRSVEFRKPNGEIEPIPVGYVVEIQADHVEHHVNRILSIRRELDGT
jgi:hypothetical protein